MKYEEVYEDHKYLWSIGPANDMTGAYVDSNDLDKLLKNPTKATAKEILLSQMAYWFEAGIENGESNTGIPVSAFIDKYPRIDKIAIKYGFDY